MFFPAHNGFKDLITTTAVMVLELPSVLCNPQPPLDQVKLNGSQSWRQLEAVTGQRVGLQVVQGGGCSTVVARWHRRASTQFTVHRHSWLAATMEWQGDSRLIGGWTCCRADSRHSGSPDRWLLPRRISGPVWKASCAQETWGSPRCCYSSSQPETSTQH